MSAWLQATIAGYLLVVLQGSCRAVEITERRTVAVGSSVLLHAPRIQNVNFTEWEYIRNTTPEFILQYYADYQSPTIYSAYQGRVVFYPENGSLLLQRVQETDSGIYKATVDLMQDKAWTTLLEVIQPVPQPELQYSSNLAGSPIELVCVVPEGRVDSMFWKKDGQPLSPEKCYGLSGHTLRIRKGEKSDCGSFSCNVSNVISWKEAELNLMVTGLTPPLRHVQRVTVVALMFLTTSGIGFVVLLCQPRECSLGKEELKHLSLFAHELLCISSLLLFATSIIWMWEEGLSAAFFLFGLFFFVAAIGTAQAAVAVVWRPAALSHFKNTVWHQVIRNSIAPTPLIVNLLFSTLLLHNTQQLHERGCSEAVDLTLSCVLAALAILLMLLVHILLCYHRSKQKGKMTKKQDKTQDIQTTATLVTHCH
ncbi:natural killer cell receptor 2b4 isoform x1 [Limosa lapponica baueri]|uniref:Natural killer cell receptor 2b4 isoform x1 n=1 Tax=Limosa lapponica baueri TaxID=1758121 RepID=A0A2I0TGC9_LIMLA|nr:natural killer cell receptor 2b4 isoform x1 [Limosa lapponica baueri]